MYAHVYKIKKWSATKQIAVTECYGIDQGEAMKMLNGGRVPH